MTRYSEFDAIIFDMDGLLVDTEPVWEEAENEMLGEYNISLDAEVRMGLVGLRNDVFLGRLKDRYNIPATLDELQVDVIGRMLKLIPEKAKPMTGAAEIIQFVVENKIPVAIASSSPGAIIQAVVESNRWQQVIPVLCSAEHLLAGKPEPHVYLEAARILGVEPTRCLALEDSTNGARAAIAAGMTCYAVPDLSHTRWEAFAGITDQLFHNLHDVLNHLKQVQ